VKAPSNPDFAVHRRAADLTILDLLPAFPNPVMEESPSTAHNPKRCVVMARVRRFYPTSNLVYERLAEEATKRIRFNFGAILGGDCTVRFRVSDTSSST